MTISNLNDLKHYFENLNREIVSIGVYAFDNIGLETLTNNFSIIALNYSLDTELIEKHVKLLSLEKKTPKTFREIKRNSLSMLRTESVKNYLSNFRNPLIISYKGRAPFEQICRQNGYISAVGRSDLYKFLDNKSNFRKILVDNNINCYPPYLSFSYDELLSQEYKNLKKILGTKLVVQGKHLSTKFVFNKASFQNVLSELGDIENKPADSDQYIVSKYIVGRPASITCIATKWGIFTSNVQYQLIDIKELTSENGKSGFFCGHDWSSSKDISESVNLKAAEFARLFGQIIYNMGYKGFFGLDLIIEEETDKIYINECNPRMTGVLPTIDLIQYKNNEIPFLGLHCLEYLEDHITSTLTLDFNKIDASLKQIKQGAHFFISSGIKGPVILETKLKPGVYTIEGSELKYIREGYSIQDLNNNSEFIFSETPSANLRIDRLSRIGRVITLAQISKDQNTLNAFGTSIVNGYRNSIKFTKI